MIFILCKLCKQGTSLSPQELKSCACGQAYGYYTEGGVALSSAALPIGIANGSIQQAARERPYSGFGYRLDAVLMPIKGFIIDDSIALKRAQEREAEDGRSEDVSSERDGSGDQP